MPGDSSQVPGGPPAGAGDPSRNAYPPQRKRIQNAACDTCKLRRIKCDLPDKQPGESCSKCVEKSINCTSHQISNVKSASNKSSSVEGEETGVIIGGLPGEGAPSPPSTASGHNTRVNSIASESLASSRHSSLTAFNAGNMLADKVKRFALERELINLYFSTSHASLTVLDAPTFHKEFNEANQVSENMSLESEVVCVILQAWAARYSGHSSFLGDGLYNESHRESICRQLLTKATKLFDERGMMRNPTVTSTSALILLAPLVGWDASNDPDTKSAKHTELRTLYAAIGSHIEILGLLNVAKQWDPLKIKTSLTITPTQRVTWAAFHVDSMYALSSRKKSFIDEDAFFEINPRIPRFGSPLPPAELIPTPDAVGATLVSLPIAASITYNVNKLVLIPAGKPGSQQLEDFEIHVRKLWDTLGHTLDWLQEISFKALSLAPQTFTLFSPVLLTINTRMVFTLNWIYLYQAVAERYHQARHSGLSGISSDLGAGNLDLVRLEALWNEGFEVCLRRCRETVVVIRHILPTKLLQISGRMLVEIRAVARFLAEAPCQENGYNGPSVTWTLSNKQKEVGSLLEGMEQISFVFPLAHNINDVRAILHQRTPSCAQPSLAVPDEAEEARYNRVRELMNVLFRLQSKSLYRIFTGDMNMDNTLITEIMPKVTDRNQHQFSADNSQELRQPAIPQSSLSSSSDKYTSNLHPIWQSFPDAEVDVAPFLNDRQTQQLEQNFSLAFDHDPLPPALFETHPMNPAHSYPHGGPPPDL